MLPIQDLEFRTLIGISLKGTGRDTKQMNFRKSSKVGGGVEVIFNPNIYVADFGSSKQGFIIMKLIQNSNFRVRVAELGSLSSGAKMAIKIFVKRIFTIFAEIALFLHVIANLQI